MIKLIIDIDGKEYKLTMEQAKKLQADLNQLLGQQEIIINWPTYTQPCQPYNPITNPQITYYWDGNIFCETKM